MLFYVWPSLSSLVLINELMPDPSISDRVNQDAFFLFPLFCRIPSLLKHFHKCVPRVPANAFYLHLHHRMVHADTVFFSNSYRSAEHFFRKHKEQIHRSEIIPMLLLHITTRAWWAFCTTIFWSFERGLYFESAVEPACKCISSLNI